ncbi:methyltransferase family protein [Parasynechococcus sp.]|uniref:methyltransferase family protein n=1 Tax=Parasynechococcus sp. TaxID=3101203 RepID=UPI003704816D
MLKGWGLSWGGWLDNRRGEWWLLAQLTLITAHLCPAWPAHGQLGLTPWPLGLVITGVALLGYGAVLAVRAFLDLGDSLSPLPAVRDEHRLIVTGAYQRCRHPLYQAVLCCSLGVCIASGSGLHLALLLGLIGVLGGKARFEERDLRRRYPDYATYAQTTTAIVPKLPWLDWSTL